MSGHVVNGNLGIVTFAVDYDYKPQAEGEIELRTGDICVVAKPIIDVHGWLKGTNKNTGEYGDFPGTFASVVEDFTLPPPPRPPKPDAACRGSLLSKSVCLILMPENECLLYFFEGRLC